MDRLAALLTIVGLTLTGAASAQNVAERTSRNAVVIIAPDARSSELAAVVDLADVVDDATRRVVPMIGKGALQSVSDLRSLRGIDMAIIQTDVLAAAKARGNPGLERSMTYVSKLFNSEFHLLAGEQIASIADLAGKKVNVDLAGSGTAVTAQNIFQRLKLNVEVTNFDLPTAFLRLKSGEIAALAYVTSKPSPVFAHLPPGNSYRLLPIPVAPDNLGEYLPARLTAEDYPGLVKQPVDTVAVGTALLVANLQPNTERYRNASGFVEAFFTLIGRLNEPPHHPRWSEVSLSAEMPGWRRFPAAEAWLKANAAPTPSIDDAQLREIFTKFLDERSRLSRGRALTAEQKEKMFDEFRRWQATQRQ